MNVGPPWERKNTGVAAPTVLGDNDIATGFILCLNILLNQLIKGIFKILILDIFLSLQTYHLINAFIQYNSEIKIAH